MSRLRPLPIPSTVFRGSRALIGMLLLSLGIVASTAIGRETADQSAKPVDVVAVPERDVAATPEAAALPSEEAEAVKAAVARPVPAEPVQVFGWRELVKVEDLEEPFHAKLDTGALSSSMHAEDIELFERDGEKWVRFIAANPREADSKRVPVEAPLVRHARIKLVGGGYSRREVVSLKVKIGERSLRGEFTLADRSNMLVPVLIGRTMLGDLGWVDSRRTYLADQKIFR